MRQHYVVPHATRQPAVATALKLQVKYFIMGARFYFYAKDIAPEKKKRIKNKIITKIKTEPKEKNETL